jgi:hypothetical protein
MTNHRNFLILNSAAYNLTHLELRFNIYDSQMQFVFLRLRDSRLPLVINLLQLLTTSILNSLLKILNTRINPLEPKSLKSFLGTLIDIAPWLFIDKGIFKGWPVNIADQILSYVTQIL